MKDTIYYAAYVPASDGYGWLFNNGQALIIPDAKDTTKCIVKSAVIDADVATLVSNGVPVSPDESANDIYIAYGKTLEDAVNSLFVKVFSSIIKANPSDMDNKARLDKFFEDAYAEFARRDDYRDADVYAQIGVLPLGFNSSCWVRNACPSISAEHLHFRDADKDDHFVSCDIWIKAKDARPMPCANGTHQFTLQINVDDHYYLEFGSDSWADVMKQASKAIGFQSILRANLEGHNNIRSVIEQHILIASAIGFQYFEKTYPHWINRSHVTAGSEVNMLVCPECGEEFGWDAETGRTVADYNYCPNCGVYLKGTSSSH